MYILILPRQIFRFQRKTWRGGDGEDKGDRYKHAEQSDRCCIYERNRAGNYMMCLAGKPIFIICDEVYNQLVYADECVSLASYEI